MNKKRFAVIALVSVAMLLVMACLIGHTCYSVNSRITRSCFEELTVATNQLTEELHTAIGNDHTMLSAIANIVAIQDDRSDAALCATLRAFSFDTTYISHLALLKPDGTLLYADQTRQDASDILRFEEEVRQSWREPEQMVILHAIPIKRDGEALYMLYGVVKLSELAQAYKAHLYDGHAYVYIEDGDTGDFILDTWHKQLGNIKDLGKRKTLPGYDLDKAVQDMSSGVSGEIAFVSRTTGSVLYMRYEPLGVNNWNVFITVEEAYAFAKSEGISKSLYLMAALCGLILLAYFVFVLSFLIGAYRLVRKLGTEDQSTGLLNRNSFHRYIDGNQTKQFAQITCIFIDVNGLHEINNRFGHAEGDRLLRMVADALRLELGRQPLFRIGGDEFVAFSVTDGEAACHEKLRRIDERIKAEKFSISYGIVSFSDEIGLNRVVREADTCMLNAKSAFYAAHERRRGRAVPPGWKG